MSLQNGCAADACAVLALDLESVLVPEIWEAVARAAGVPELAATTRDIADYELLMQRRIALCRANGLTLPALRKIVTAMGPLPGAPEFLAWAQTRALVVIVSDTFHELAGPILAKLGNPLMLCNRLTLDDHGYIAGCELRDGSGKVGAIERFRRLGLPVLAVGDSFNDLAMLEAADAPFLFRPAARVADAAGAHPTFWTFEELRTAVDSRLKSDQS